MKKVVHPREVEYSEYFTIIACDRESTYFEMKELLLNYFKEAVEFQDFAWSFWYGREIVVIQGNCHTRVIKRMLNSCEEFWRKYYIYPIPQIQYLRNKIIDENLLKNCDVFIHQDMRSDTWVGYHVSDEYLYARIGNHTKNIVILNLFGLGSFMFPQSYYQPGACKKAGWEKLGNVSRIGALK